MKDDKSPRVKMRKMQSKINQQAKQIAILKEVAECVVFDEENQDQTSVNRGYADGDLKVDYCKCIIIAQQLKAEREILFKDIQAKTNEIEEMNALNANQAITLREQDTEIERLKKELQDARSVVIVSGLEHLLNRHRKGLTND